MYDSTFIKLDAAGLNPTELCDVVAFRVKTKVDEPLRPLPIKIENGGDFRNNTNGGLSTGAKDIDDIIAWSATTFKSHMISGDFTLGAFARKRP